MQVEVNRRGDAAVISVSGDVDLYTSPEVRKAITRMCKKKVPVIVINLAEVAYMDSSGVATLVEGLQLSGRYEGAFRIVGLQPAVREVFELARLDHVFAIFESEEQAVGG
ncbi:MAG: STAS domain-containing protein [Candidatus Glassbacteria bacterium]|nr:STAS domain-containing protein [Candidatus Glassbacteria bacterium]